MSKRLVTNVFVSDVDDQGTVRGGGTFYGPDYPENEVTAAVLASITNPAAFEEDPAPVDPNSSEAGDLRRALGDDAGAYSDEELEDLSKADLEAVAASRGIELPAKATKVEILAALQG